MLKGKLQRSTCWPVDQVRPQQCVFTRNTRSCTTGWVTLFVIKGTAVEETCVATAASHPGFHCCALGCPGQRTTELARVVSRQHP